MTGRFASCFAVCLAVCGAVGFGTSTAEAQYPDQHPAQRPDLYPGRPQYGQPATPPGVHPASYAAGAWAQPPDLAPGQPLIHERMLSQDRGWGYRDTEFDHLLEKVVDNTWIRLDYMLWEASRPGDHLLGAGIKSVNNPRVPFPVTPPGGGAPLGTATVPTLDSIGLRDASGMRATVALKLLHGTLEANVFGFTQNDDDFYVPDLGAQAFGPTPGGGSAALPIFAATSTLVNGQLGNNQFLYDHTFRARYAQDIWGVGFNYVVNAPKPGEGLKILPLIGFRYLEIDEGLYQMGIFNGGFDGVVDLGEDLNSNGVLDPGEDTNGDGVLDPGLVTHIDSIVNNEIFAPQVGVRIELQHRWFSLGIEPKVAFGINRSRMQVATSQLRSYGDPLTISTARSTRFAQIGECRLYGKLHLTDDLSFFIAYDIMVAGGVSRAYDNVVYNDNGPNDPPAFDVAPGFEILWWQGMTIGGQIWLR